MPVHRLVFHEITQRSHPRGAWRPRAYRPEPGRAQETRRISTGCTATKFRRCCGARCGPSFRGPRAKRGGAIDRRARARADGVCLRHVLGLARPRSPSPAARSSKPSSSRSTAESIPAGKDFDSATGKIKNPELHAARRAGSRRNWPSDSPRRIPRGFGRRQAVHPKPYPPFTTSTLQQEANRKLGFTARRTMQVAQACTKTATSLTCVPTRRTWPRWPSTRPATWWRRIRQRITCPTSRAFTKPK